MSGGGENGLLNQQLQGLSNCIIGPGSQLSSFPSYDCYPQGTTRSVLDVAYFLKHASEDVLVDMYQRIPAELKARVDAARGRERAAQEAYEKVASPKAEP